MITLVDSNSRIDALPKDERGYPVPWFVAWVDGKPQFPIMDAAKFYFALSDKRCWVCGEKLGAFYVFVVGPMCGISRTAAEPASHRDCAIFSVKNCPFLVNPKMKRIENKYTKDGEPMAGIMLARNPGVTLLWTTKSFKIFQDHNRRHLIQMGDPLSIECWAEGRRATAEEIDHSVTTGIPALAEHCETERDKDDLRKAVNEFAKLLRQNKNTEEK